jgi:ABC-type transporter Mla subunit MlaD
MLLASAPIPAHAASKEIIELQTQVQQLLDMVQRLQSTFDSRFSVLQHLAEQTADDANRMTATVNSLQQKINAQGEAVNGKLDTTSGQVQSLNDSVDELKSRIAKLDKSVQEMQTQLQNTQNPAAGAPPHLPPASLPQAPPATRRRRCKRPIRPASATTTLQSMRSLRVSFKTFSTTIRWTTWLAAPSSTLAKSPTGSRTTRMR